MKKKFLPAFNPPRLVVGKSATYILVYCFNKSGERIKYRNSYDLNRIHNLNDRIVRGNTICLKINWWLSQGNFYEDFEEWRVNIAEIPKPAENSKHLEPVEKALEVARAIKCNSARDNTKRSYNSHINRLLDYLKKKKKLHLPVVQFDRVGAIEYLDYYRFERKVKNITFNNVLRHQRSIWNALVKRGYLPENPFDGIDYLRKEKKQRRNFKPHECKVVLNEIYQSNRVLFYAIILQYTCLIRPEELRRLRFYDIHIDAGIVTVSAEISKSHKERTPTIPDAYLHFFKEKFWSQYPEDYLIFGLNMQPHPNISCGKDRMYRQHKKELQNLCKSGKLESMKGLTFYSWKDTGITDAVEQIGLMAASDQAGHSKPDTTMIYRHQRRINKKMKLFKNPLV